jgi:hypothetical protein
MPSTLRSSLCPRAPVDKGQEISKYLATSKSRLLMSEREDTPLFMEKGSRSIINRLDQGSHQLFPPSPSSLSSKCWPHNNNRFNSSTIQCCRCKPCSRMVETLLKSFTKPMKRTPISSDPSSSLPPTPSLSPRFSALTRTLNQTRTSPFKCQSNRNAPPSHKLHGLFSTVFLTVKMAWATLNQCLAMSRAERVMHPALDLGL